MDGEHMSGDAEVDEFVDVNLVSFPAWDLITFLHKNPHTDATVHELCGSLARQEKDLAPALQRCVATGVAEEHECPDGLTRFRLSADDRIRSVIDRFCEFSHDREVRLEFVRKVMGRLATTA